MIRLPALVLLTLLAIPARADLLLAGQRIEFDHGVPKFTSRQVKGTAKATRLGLSKWAATDQGRELISRFDSKQYRIVITEDDEEQGFGRAPQPALATLMAAQDAAVVKEYELLLNPRFDVPERFTILPGEPSTPGEMMAAAWAAEMLHIDFYADGVSLPHHSREDFRERWAEVAGQLGWPTMRHGEGGE